MANGARGDRGGCRFDVKVAVLLRPSCTHPASAYTIQSIIKSAYHERRQSIE